MGLPETTSRVPELEDGQAAVFPYLPFNRGYLLDNVAREDLRKKSLVLAGVTLFALQVATMFHVPSYAIGAIALVAYRIIARRATRGCSRVPGVPLSQWIEAEGRELTRLYTGLVILICAGLTGVCGWVISEAKTPGKVIPALLGILVFSGFGMLAMQMYRARSRSRYRD